eukprot:8329183-Alexandrium_andersonii.AAC.1
MASAQPGPFGEQELQSLRGAATREVTVGAPNPGFAHGVAMRIFCRQDDASAQANTPRAPSRSASRGRRRPGPQSAEPRSAGRRLAAGRRRCPQA